VGDLRRRGCQGDPPFSGDISHFRRRLGGRHYGLEARLISDDGIRRVMPQRSFAAGVRYHLDGRVQKLCMAAEGTTINAFVLGSGYSIYEQSVRLQRNETVSRRFMSCILGAGNGTTLALTEADLEMLFG